MDLSIIAARTLAVIYIAVGSGMLLGQINLSRLVEEFKNSAALTYVTGFMAVVLGMLLTAHHNLWVKDWRVLITLIGWIVLLKGILLICRPDFMGFFKIRSADQKVWAVFILVIGAFFAYFGFLHAA